MWRQAGRVFSKTLRRSDLRAAFVERWPISFPVCAAHHNDVKKGVPYAEYLLDALPLMEYKLRFIA